MMRTTQESAPWGGPVAFAFLPRAGLNFAIYAMVASVHDTTRRNGAARRLRCLLQA
jgi:hypothetical protein